MRLKLNTAIQLTEINTSATDAAAVNRNVFLVNGVQHGGAVSCTKMLALMLFRMYVPCWLCKRTNIMISHVF